MDHTGCADASPLSATTPAGLASYRCCRFKRGREERRESGTFGCRCMRKRSETRPHSSRSWEHCGPGTIRWPRQRLRQRLLTNRARSSCSDSHVQRIGARANGCLLHRKRPAAEPSLAGRLSTIEEVRIATWCVGGVNSRLKYLCHWLIRRKPDLVALQKTFAATAQFPVRALRQAGYESVSYSRDGEFRNGWGVAVLIRVTDPKPKVLRLGVPG